MTHEWKKKKLKLENGGGGKENGIKTKAKTVIGQGRGGDGREG